MRLLRPLTSDLTADSAGHSVELQDVCEESYLRGGRRRDGARRQGPLRRKGNDILEKKHEQTSDFSQNKPGGFGLNQAAVSCGDISAKVEFKVRIQTFLGKQTSVG